MVRYIGEFSDNPSGVASENLRRAEENASNAANEGDTSNYSAGTEESSAGGLYTGGGKDGDNKKETKGKGKGFFKRKGPMALIMSLVLGGGGMMMGSQSLMPMAIEEMIIEKFNSIGISTTMASDAWLNTQLNQGVRLKNLQSGDTENLFAFSRYQVSQFNKYGILVLDNIGGGEITRIMALLYKKGDKYIPVVGSDYIGREGLEGAIKAAAQEKFKISNIGSPISAKEALSDPEFKNAYTAASKTWRGGASGWFDNIMSTITETKLSINRNRWARWVTNSITDLTKEFKKGAASAASSASDAGFGAKEFTEIKNDKGDVVDTKVGEIDDVKIEDATPEQMEIIRQNGGGETVDTSNTSIPTANPTLSKVSKVLNSKAVKAASAAGEYTCALLEAAVSIYTVVSAYQNLQFLNLITGFLESVDKVKSGSGDGSPVHEYSNNLTTSGETRDDNNKVISNKSGMAAAGMSWLFSNNSIDSNDQSIKNVNIESIMAGSTKLFKNAKDMAHMFEYCGYVKAALAAVDLAATVVSFIPFIGQGIKAVQLTAKEAVKVAIKAAVQIALYIAIPIIAKNLTNMLIRDAATEWFGEDLGNALISGASKYLGGNATSGGEGPGSQAKVIMYMNEQNAVIAEEARYQRSKRNPFDLTSKYTFLGSIYYSLIPIAYSSGGVMQSMAGATNMLSNSLVALLPSASAVSTQNELTSDGSCGLLSAVKAQGDAFCNPYIITDTSTIRESPVAVNDIVHRMNSEDTILASNNKWIGVSSSNFNSDGTIKEDSNLGKYITYCGQRTSQYGIKDASIAEHIVTKGKKVHKIIGYIPALKNIKDIREGLKDEANMAWSNGRACVASEDNEYWDELKWYQRYAENIRLVENINPGYVGPTTAYLNKYYEENPVDDSFEGQLARFSGMSKEKVSDTLALMEYYQFLAEYDASTRYAFGAPAVEEKHDLTFDNENQVAETIHVILLNEISFADVRNRVALV
jgi:hypothetical protein